MDGIQAAVLRVKMKHIAEWNRLRQQHAATYDRLFASPDLLRVRQRAGAFAGAESAGEACVSSVCDSRAAPG